MQAPGSRGKLKPRRILKLIGRRSNAYFNRPARGLTGFRLERRGGMYKRIICLIARKESDRLAQFSFNVFPSTTFPSLVLISSCIAFWPLQDSSMR